MRELIARYRPLVKQIVSFALVGLLGLGVDAAVLYGATKGLGLGPLVGRLVSYPVAATATWWLNRTFTFRTASRRAALRQWGMFLLANLSGFVANYGTYGLCVLMIPICAEIPVLALIPAAVVGMLFNFTASKSVVFVSR